MCDGVKTRPLIKHIDERGFFCEIFRTDWSDIIKTEVNQFNLSYSYPGIIRAWHRHNLDQIDYFICIKGSLKICTYNDNDGYLTEKIVSGDNPTICRIPGHLWHGYKVLGTEPAYLVYGVNNLYDYKNPDEERRPWNDPNIIPRSINGKKDDQRIGKPWNWNYPPYK